MDMTIVKSEFNNGKNSYGSKTYHNIKDDRNRTYYDVNWDKYVFKW